MFLCKFIFLALYLTLGLPVAGVAQYLQVNLKWHLWRLDSKILYSDARVLQRAVECHILLTSLTIFSLPLNTHTYRHPWPDSSNTALRWQWWKISTTQTWWWKAPTQPTYGHGPNPVNLDRAQSEGVVRAYESRRCVVLSWDFDWLAFFTLTNIPPSFHTKSSFMPGSALTVNDLRPIALCYSSHGLHQMS